MGADGSVVRHRFVHGLEKLPCRGVSRYFDTLDTAVVLAAKAGGRVPADGPVATWYQEYASAVVDSQRTLANRFIDLSVEIQRWPLRLAARPAH